MIIPRFDIIIISYNCCEHTLNCLKSIYELSLEHAPHIIVYDNASTDDTELKVRQAFPDVLFIKNNSNSGYAAAINNAVKYAENDLIVVSNADVIFFKDSLTTLIGFIANNSTVGICGPQQQYSDGSWEYSYGDFPGIGSTLKDLFLISSFGKLIRKIFWNKFRLDKFPREVDYVDGAVMAIRKDAFLNVNGFDESFFFYSEEADFCFRLKQNGWLVFFNPKANVMHFRGGSSSKIGMNEDTIVLLVKSKAQFCKKHYSKTYLKIYVYLEKLSSKFFTILWFIIYKMGIGKSIAKKKYLMFKMLFSNWEKIECK